MRHLIAILFIAICASTQAQNPDLDIDHKKDQQTDTTAFVLLTEAIVKPESMWSRRSQKRYGRLKRKVVKVYPYAKAAGDIMKSVDAELRAMDHKKDRKKYLKAAEADLKTQFEGELKSLTMSEGVILIKLIDRETGDCSYE
ncbi:MAG: DUF4294 domain-containing protein, partial [Flavobacteriales bacterium]